MRIKLFFLISSLVAFFFGFSLIFGQEMMMESYMATPEEITPGSRVLALVYGCLLIGFGVGLLLARRASMSYGRRAMLAAVAVADILVVIVHIYAIQKGWETSMAWGTVVLCAILGGWAVLLFLREKVD